MIAEEKPVWFLPMLVHTFVNVNYCFPEMLLFPLLIGVLWLGTRGKS